MEYKRLEFIQFADLSLHCSKPIVLFVLMFNRLIAQVIQ